MNRVDLFRVVWRTAVSTYLQRLYRLVTLPLYDIRPNRGFLHRCFDAPFEWILLIADLMFIPELYSTLGILTKTNIRGLSETEKEIYKHYHFNSLPLDVIHIDDKAWIGPSWSSFAYVSFYCINYYKNLSTVTLAHELVHVWQFHRFGSVYIYHALMSQWSRSGYDYGGYDSLKDAAERYANLLSFNFEQQGDILAEYYRLLLMQKRGVPVLEERLNVYYEIMAPLRA